MHGPCFGHEDGDKHDCTVLAFIRLTQRPVTNTVAHITSAVISNLLRFSCGCVGVNLLFVGAIRRKVELRIGTDDAEYLPKVRT